MAPEVARRLAGERRHATRAQRRALKAQRGSVCAVNGCTQPGLVPHHVQFFSHGGRTVLPNLVPICPHHHHDVHEGHRPLRDGRLVGPDGWIGLRRTAA